MSEEKLHGAPFDTKEKEEKAWVLFGDAALVLKSSVASSRGRLLIVVHPNQARGYVDFFPKLERVLDKNVIPAIFFEEESYVGATRDWVSERKGTGTQMPPVIIKTDPCMPLPQHMNWDEVRSALAFLEPTTVFIGGVNLHYPRPLGKNPTEEMGCVNELWRELSRMSGVSIVPALGHPMIRRDADRYKTIAEEG